MRLFEVVAHDLVGFDEVARLRLEPACEALVQLGPGRLRESVICGVADEQMAEPEPVVSRELGPVGSDVLLANERGQSRRHLQLVGAEGLYGAAVEDLTLDRASLENTALLGLELVDTRGEQRLDRRWHDDLGILRALEHRHHLLHEERVPPGRTKNTGPEGSVDQPARQTVVHQQLTGILGKRLEPKRQRPAWTAVEELWPRAAQQQDRGAPREQGDVLDEVEKGVLSPVDVIEDDDERSSSLEQLAEAPGDFLTRRWDVAAEKRTDRLRSLRLHRNVRQLLHDFDDRPVGDPLAVGEAAATNDADAGLGDHLGRESRLADPGRAEHGDELAAHLCPRAHPRLAQRHQLSFPPDDRCVQPSGRRFSRGREEPVGRNGLGLPLQRERLDRLRLGGIAGKPHGFCPDEDLTGLRRLLQAGGDVHGITGREALLGAGDDLAGVHADPGLYPQLRKRVPHLDCGSQCPQCVVLVHDGHPEHSHDRIPYELLHRPAIRLDDPPHLLEIATEQSPQRFRVSRLAECGRARHVTEQNRHDLPVLDRLDAERGTAYVTETGVRAVDGATGGATHASRLLRLTSRLMAARARLRTGRPPLPSSSAVPG